MFSILSQKDLSSTTQFPVSVVDVAFYLYTIQKKQEQHSQNSIRADAMKQQFTLAFRCEYQLT